MKHFRRQLISVLSLFGSTGTLLCCALPIAIASMAGGAAVVSLISTFPFLIPLSRYKIWIFLIAGILLFIQGMVIIKPQSQVACAITGDTACQTAARWSRRLFVAAAIIYFIGAFTAFALTPLLRILHV